MRKVKAKRINVPTLLCLEKLKINQKGTIVAVKGQGVTRRRLFDMGVTPGALVTLIKLAPLGDPLEINIRNYELTLRKDEAKNVILEVEDN